MYKLCNFSTMCPGARHGGAQHVLGEQASRRALDAPGGLQAVGFVVDPGAREQHLCGNQAQYGRPARTHHSTNWPRLAEAGRGLRPP